MTRSPVVCNASPLIALAQIDQLDLLAQMFDTVVVPPAVVHEIAPTVIVPGWISQQTLNQPIGAAILQASLGPGESEAIGLALEMEAQLVILDDRPARRLAQALGLSVIGTLGVLLAAQQRSLLRAVKPCLDTLLDHDFRISPGLYERILADAGEL